MVKNISGKKVGMIENSFLSGKIYLRVIGREYMSDFRYIHNYTKNTYIRFKPYKNTFGGGPNCIWFHLIYINYTFAFVYVSLYQGSERDMSDSKLTCLEIRILFLLLNLREGRREREKFHYSV